MPSSKRKAAKQGVAAAEEEEGEDEYEATVPLEGSGFKRRRVGAKQWQHHCEHGRQKASCKQCGKSSICDHGRQHSRCKECGGSICEYGRIRSRCRECAGSAMRVLSRRRGYCKQ